MKKNAEDLGLSDEIIAKIDAAIEAGNVEETKFREQGKTAVSELNEVLAKNLPSKKELMAASDKVGENIVKSRTLKMNSVLEMRSLLTPEQLEKFMKLRQKATARR